MTRWAWQGLCGADLERDGARNGAWHWHCPSVDSKPACVGSCDVFQCSLAISTCENFGGGGG